jgi:hypothetical protein
MFMPDRPKRSTKRVQRFEAIPSSEHSKALRQKANSQSFKPIAGGKQIKAAKPPLSTSGAAGAAGADANKLEQWRQSEIVEGRPSVRSGNESRVKAVWARKSIDTSPSAACPWLRFFSVDEAGRYIDANSPEISKALTSPTKQTVQGWEFKYAENDGQEIKGKKPIKAELQLAAVPNVEMPATLRDEFELKQTKKCRITTGDARAVCESYENNDCYDVMSFVDGERTARYQQALRRKAKGACVMDLGTGANCTLAIAGLEAGASLVLAFELNEQALKRGAKSLRQYMSQDKENAVYGAGKRILPGTIALKLERTEKGKGRQEVWLIRGDATKSCFHPEVLSKLKSCIHPIILVHELFDDIATSEDVCAIVGAVQGALKKIFGGSFLPQSVPERAQTLARPLSILAQSRKRKRPLLSGTMTSSGSAIFTHSQIPHEWYEGNTSGNTSEAQPLEMLDFESKCATDCICGEPVKFSFNRQVTALALSLKIDFGADETYDVRQVLIFPLTYPSPHLSSLSPILPHSSIPGAQ